MRLIKVLAVILALVAFVLLGAPLAGKWAIKNWFEARGFEPVIKQVSFDYFHGSVTLGSASIDLNGQNQAGVFAMELDLDIPRLFGGEWIFDKIAIDNIHFTADQSSGQWMLAGLPMNQWVAKGKALNWRVKHLEVANSDVCTADRQQCFRLEELLVSELNWNLTATEWSLEHDGPLVLNKAFLQDRSNAASVLFLESLRVQGAHYTESSTALRGVQVRNFQLVENQSDLAGKELTPYQAQLGELSMDSLSLKYGDDKGISLNGVKVISLRQSFQKQKGASNLWLQRFKSWFPHIYGLWDRLDFSKPTGVSLQVQDLTLQGGKLTWRDETVSPPAIEQLSQVRLNVDHIDSNQTERSHITLDAKIGDIGALKLDSRAQFFAGAPLFDVSGFAHGVDFGNLSGYSHDIFQQRVKAGVADVSFNVGVTDGRAGGQSTWRLTGFATEAQNAPMGVAIRKLADHNNSVEFELPIGLLTEPGSNPVAALGRAVNNTLVRQAKTQASETPTLAERPVALETLPPVYFATNSVEPAELDLARIPNIVKTVKASPGKELLVCPIATRDEWAKLYHNGNPDRKNQTLTEAEKQFLLGLTARRGQQLSRLLMNEGLSPERIIVCGPSVDLDKAGPSHATLAL